MIAIDTHVHIYSEFAVEKVFRAVEQNITNFTGLSSATLCLTEKAGCFFWEELKALGSSPFGARLQETTDPLLIHIELDSGFVITFIRGYQYVSVEGLEVLGLGTAVRPGDRLFSADSLLRTVAESGGVPVLPWSVGKWLGSRGRVVGSLIQHSNSNTFVLGDIMQRASSVRLSRRFGADKTWRVFSGSDPLPLPGEEENIGKFITLIPYHEAIPTSCRELTDTLMTCLPDDISVLGKRDTLLCAARRWFRLQMVMKLRSRNSQSRSSVISHKEESCLR